MKRPDRTDKDYAVLVLEYIEYLIRRTIAYAKASIVIGAAAVALAATSMLAG